MKNQEGGAGLGVLAIVGAILLFVVILPLIGAGLGIINLPFLRLGKQVELNQGVITKTYDTEYCLNNYEWFKNTYQDIQQTDSKIANIQAQIDQFKTDAPDRTKWTFEDKQLYNNLTTELTGTRNYKADLTGQYNSRTTQLNRVACKELPLFVKP